MVLDSSKADPRMIMAMTNVPAKCRLLYSRPQLHFLSTVPLGSRAGQRKWRL